MAQKSRNICLLVALVLAAFLVGCQSQQLAAPQSLKIGVLPIEDNFPFFVAESQQMFSQAGVDVELVPFNSARDRDIALMSGQIDGEVADIIAAALLKKSGTDVRIVSLTMGVTPQEGRFALLSAPNSGITTAEQLAGVPVAVSQHTIIEYVADQLMLQAGVPKESIQKTVVAAIPDRLQLLLNGSVKAAVLPDPFATLARVQGAQVVLDDTQSQQNLSQVVLLFRTDVINQKSQAIKKLIGVYAKSAQEVNTHPEKYRELFVERARVPAPLKDTYLTPSFSPPQLPKTADVSRVMDWMVAKELLSAPFTYQELVDESLLAGS
ncbi:metal ABC transporter substrate-binding protein [Clostridiales bacterium PH28_bin88]|nr:metal ABC transporter substrate-binding protein [Clostridiales bacterium PH28_bin88]